MAARLAARLLLAGTVGGVAIAALPVEGPAADRTGDRSAVRVSRLQIDAGYAGAYQPTAPIPVRVTVSADRLVKGTLRVNVAGALPVHVPAEVAGGSRKRFVVVVPAPDASGTMSVQAVIEEAKLEGIVELPSRDSAELVGLLPAMVGGRPMPSPAKLAVDVGVARFSTVTEAELALAPASLQALGSLAATPDDLLSLSEREGRGVAAWVSGGGRLLVAVDKGVTVAGLSKGLQPGRSGRARVGTGEVIAAGRSLGQRSWDGVIEPTPLGGRRATFGFGRGGPRLGLGDELAADTGFRVPRLAWLVPALVGYVAAATLLTFLLLRRRRLAPWVWAGLGVLGVAVGVGAAVGNRGVRSHISPAHASVITAGPLGSEAVTFVGVARGDPGVARVSFPAGWTAEALPSEVVSFGGGAMATTTGVAAMRGSRLTAEVELGAGSFGVVGGRGPVAVKGSLEVNASAESDDRVSGTVRNTTPWRLEQVAVFVDTASTNVGILEPGEQREWTVFVADFNGSDRAPGLEVWPVPTRFTGTADDMDVNFPMWWAWASPRLPLLMTPGRALAVGWTRSPVPTVQLDRPVATKGRTALIGTAQVSGNPEHPFRTAVARTVLRAGDGGTARFDLPSGGTSPQLVAHVAAGTQVDAWMNGEWKQVSPTDPAAAQGPGQQPTFSSVSSVLSWTDLPLPPAANLDGRVYLRARGFLTASPAASPIELITVGAPPAIGPVGS